MNLLLMCSLSDAYRNRWFSSMSVFTALPLKYAKGATQAKYGHLGMSFLVKLLEKDQKTDTLQICLLKIID